VGVLRERALVRKRAGVLSFWEEGESGGILWIDCTTVSIQQYSSGEILVTGPFIGKDLCSAHGRGCGRSALWRSWWGPGGHACCSDLLYMNSSTIRKKSQMASLSLHERLKLGIDVRFGVVRGGVCSLVMV